MPGIVISFVTTDPAPMMTLSHILTGNMVAFEQEAAELTELMLVGFENNKIIVDLYDKLGFEASCALQKLDKIP